MGRPATVRLLLAAIGAAVGLIALLPVILLWCPFRLVGILVRGVATRLEPEVVPWTQIVERDEHVGWRPKGHVDAHLFADDVFHVTTDAEGWRGRATIEGSQVVVVGDSYAFGHGVDDEDFFADLVVGPTVKAVGVHGYNMVQEYLWMCRLANRLRDKIVVWFVFLGNDLLDNLEPSVATRPSPYMRRGRAGRWEVATDHLGAERWPYMPARYRSTNYERILKCYRDTPTAERAFSACEALIVQANAVCADVGVRLVVMTIPDPVVMTQAGRRSLAVYAGEHVEVDPAFPDRRIEDICRRQDVQFVAGREFLGPEHYLARDDHWNPAGHRRVAEMLAQVYRDQATRRPEIGIALRRP
jgi:SGNH hydrolase-like domain, acetyltransferase AlgX